MEMKITDEVLDTLDNLDCLMRIPSSGYKELRRYKLLDVAKTPRLRELYSDKKIYIESKYHFVISRSRREHFWWEDQDLTGTDKIISFESVFENLDDSTKELLAYHFDIFRVS